MTISEKPEGVIPGIVEVFLRGKLSIVLIMAATALGVAAILLTPREEEPQIVVPLADVYVQYPGGSAEEVEKLVATPLERLLWQIDGVEHVYSISRRDMAIVTVRFFVGEDRERSLVKLHNRIQSHIDEAPPGVTGWVIKPIEIDDVPIVTVTLFSRENDDSILRRIGEEVLARLDRLQDVSRTRIAGGRRRTVRVVLNPEDMLARNTSALEIHSALAAADASLAAGAFDRADQHIRLSSGPFITSTEDVARLVVGVHEDRPVYLRDVARVADGPEEAQTYTRIGLPREGEGKTYPAVTLAVAKKKGTNAVWVAQAVMDRMEELKETLLPSDVEYIITRDYGKTANDKVNELLRSLLFAMITVVGLLIFALGWREGLIVALAVPISFALALFVNYIFGYTINRVTLFALILTLGLVVDDPITNVDNIQRHIRMKKFAPFLATLWAVKEVLPPVILSTLTIIVSFLPMFFITGMMGPYMGPMAVNVPLTVTFSTVAALSIVPWAAYRLLKHKGKGESDAGVREEPLEVEDVVPGWLRRLYRAVVDPFLRSRFRRVVLMLGVVGLLGGCGLLVVLRLVPMKMLPFDNKNELQLVINMPEGSTLERTDAVVRSFEDYLFTVPEVVDFESYVGTYSPIDFNGLVRHYYFRREPNKADIRINLVEKRFREQQSHDIALRLRKDLEEIAKQNGAKIAIVESPPGPPVIATITAELYGPPDLSYGALIQAGKRLEDLMAQEPGVADLDDSAETPHQRIDFILDKEKAALNGIDTEAAVRTLRLALTGSEPATVHLGSERNPLAIRVRFPREDRSGLAELGRVTVKGNRGELLPLDELGKFQMVPEDQPIYHKNLERVVYVFAEMAGRAPAEAIIDLGGQLKREPLPQGVRAEWAGEGEWEITVRVFRDLGLAFGAAMIGIYILLVIQTGFFILPLVIMTSIPLTAIGIIPGFFFLNLLVNRPVGGFDTPVFFTATAMIGMIALGGIVVRNSIVLIEFIQGSLKEGKPLREAILESGAVRMRPILLTAATTALGAWPITLDPIFSGLAWALIFGLFASTAFTLLIVPVMYYMIYKR